MISASEAILRDANIRSCHLRHWHNYKGFGFRLSTTSTIPSLVEHIESYSPASASGLKIHDVILAVNREDVSQNNYNSVDNSIRACMDHDPLKLLVVQQQFYQLIKHEGILAIAQAATIVEGPETMPNDYLNFLTDHKPRTCNVKLKKSEKSFGFVAIDGENSIGAYIQDILPNSPASRTSLRKCDRILEINDVYVDQDSSQSILEKISKAKDKHVVKLYVVDTHTYEQAHLKKISLTSKEYQEKTFENSLSISQYDDTYSLPPTLCSPLLSATSRLDSDIEDEDDNDNESLKNCYLPQKCNQPDRNKSSVSLNIDHLKIDRKQRTKSPIERSQSYRELKKTPINICTGDLITQKTDVIVVCSSSMYLFESICQAGGDAVSTSYNKQHKQHPNASIITVKSGGNIQSKKIYFLPWLANKDEHKLTESIKKFVSIALDKAAEENYQSIALPAIGCGQHACSASLVAAAMVQEVYRQLQLKDMDITFVISPDKQDVYDEFQKHIDSLQPQDSSQKLGKTHMSFKNSVIEVEMGDLTKQMVDVIIGSSSSDILRKAIMNAAGRKSVQAYNTELSRHPNSVLIVIPPGQLPCKQIFFVNWEPNTEEYILKQSLADLISNVVQNMISHQFKTVAIPAIGLGNHGCSVTTVVKTMVKEMKKHLMERNLYWTVKFVVQPDQENVYDEFCQQVLTTQDGFHELQHYALPETWKQLEGNQKCVTVTPKTNEYDEIVSQFDQTMKGQYTTIVKIERIQNERWYMQYCAHSLDFQKRLQTNTEKRLYHGCPETAAAAIIPDCFNRSFAGVNGILYGVGVYFSSNAAYSHTYTKVNARGERCMFVARVLVGKTTKGNSSMKVRPLGFDSTTDGNHIFVTYHDAQAFAEYLITYK